MILRLLNPTAEPQVAKVMLGLPLRRATPVRLDETPAHDDEIDGEDDGLSFVVNLHGTRTVLLEIGVPERDGATHDPSGPVPR